MINLKNVCLKYKSKVVNILTKSSINAISGQHIIYLISYMKIDALRMIIKSHRQGCIYFLFLPSLIYSDFNNNTEYYGSITIKIIEALIDN